MKNFVFGFQIAAAVQSGFNAAFSSASAKKPAQNGFPAKKESLIYSRPGLDSAAISNDSAVSVQDGDNVGAAQERIPTSDNMSDSSNKIYHKPAEKARKISCKESAGFPAALRPAAL